MGIIGTISNCINRIPPELIDNKVVYIEVDKEGYDALDAEFAKITNDPNYTFIETKVADIGKCKTLEYGGYKIIITPGPMKSKQSNFYIAFKTKEI